MFFFFVFFSPFSIAITSLGEQRANFCACFVLSVSSSSSCLGWAAACDCCTPLTFLLPFFVLLYHINVVAAILAPLHSIFEHSNNRVCFS